MEKINMDSLVTVLAKVEKMGFHSQFEVNGKNLVSLKTEEHFLANEVKIVHCYRFEGESNPEDSSILYAIQCNTGEKGTLVDGYGPAADTDTANFMLNVKISNKNNNRNKMKKSHLSIYIIFVLTATIVLLNRYTNFHITDYRVHFFFDFFAASSLVIIIGHLFKKLQTNRSILFSFLIVGALFFLKAFFTWGGDWKTQTILYRNIDNHNKSINYQLRADRFSFGYKRRVVEIYGLAPFMEWTTDIDTLYMDKSKWEKVDIPVNEMRFPKEK